MLTTSAYATIGPNIFQTSPNRNLINLNLTKESSINMQHKNYPTPVLYPDSVTMIQSDM